MKGEKDGRRRMLFHIYINNEGDNGTKSGYHEDIMDINQRDILQIKHAAGISSHNCQLEVKYRRTSRPKHNWDDHC